MCLTDYNPSEMYIISDCQKTVPLIGRAKRRGSAKFVLEKIVLKHRKKMNKVLATLLN